LIKLTVDEEADSTDFIRVLKLDSGHFQSKITAYGRFDLTQEEKEETQSLHRLAQLSWVAGSYSCSLPVQCRNQS
jgi:hypothetical protein